MKKRFLSALLSLCVLLAILMPALAADEAELYYVIPVLSDGLTAVDLDPASMLVRGTLSGGMFTFSENAELTFTVRVEDGWTYSSTYSYFFDTDVNNRMISEQNDAVTFTYQAKRGNSIVFSDLTTVLINATPDKLPTLYITVDGGIDSVGKEDWVPALFRLETGTKVFESGNTYEGAGEIKGRGNTSWNAPQKPYSIKLEEKESLLGIPATKKYAIVTSYLDDAFMRNYIAYKSALSMIGIQYSPKIEFVEVYIGGTYRGIYSLVERIDIEKTKVNIEEADPESGNLTGGYIIEKDVGVKIDWNNDPWFWAPLQTNPEAGGDVFTLKSPDPDEEGEMIKYLSSYINDVHNALMSGEEEAQKYVDFSSWVDFLILQELAKNVDSNLYTSCYFVKEKDNNALRMDAPWDFDLAFGNPRCTWASIPTTTPDGFRVTHMWFQTLYGYNSFHSLVRERYSKYRAEMIPDMQNMVYEQAAYLSKAAVSHADTWGRGGNLSSSVNTLIDFLNGRINWLDGQWLDTSYQTIPLNTVIEGSGSVSADSDVIYGTSATVTITPDSNKKIESITWNGVDVTAETKNGCFMTPIMTEPAELKVVFGDNRSISEGSIPSGGTTAGDVNQSPQTTFPDVVSDAYYADPVAWAVENGITYGNDDGTFAPGRSCTRAEIMTFLWRAKGSPKVSGVSFSDVDANAYYADAVAWAVANGVTYGTSDTTFSPNDPCTRADAMSFLHRAKGSPTAGGDGFSDVDTTAYYADAVAWAVANSIAYGNGDGTFSPDKPCSRADIMCFLYRAMVNR